MSNDWSSNVYAPFIKKFFENRGIAEADIHKFLDHSPVYHDPFLLKDMDKAVDCVIRHFGSRIAIFGDYDVDGITSTALLVKALRILTSSDITPIVPSRSDGYGFSVPVAERLNEGNYSLVILVDNGSKAVEAVRALTNVEVVVLDHHTVDDLENSVYRDVVAMVNPQRPDCTYPNKSLCACAVSLKFISAIFQRANKKHLLDAIMPTAYQLAALATVADMMNLADLENRHIVRYGMDFMRKREIVPFLASVFDVKRTNPATVNPEMLAFTVAPLLNAVSRVGDVQLALDLVMANARNISYPLAEKANQLNEKRKDMQSKAVDGVVSDLAFRGITPNSVIPRAIFAKINSKHGILGTVSAQLSRIFNRPAFVYAEEDGKLTGSARNTPSSPFNLHDLVLSQSQHLLRFGGHHGAVGFSLLPENESAFIQAIEEELERIEFIPRPPQESITPDAELDFINLDEDFCEVINAIGPFGVESFTAPCFESDTAHVATNTVKVFSNNHLKFIAHDEHGNAHEVIGWSKGDIAPALKSATKSISKMVFRIDASTMQGSINPMFPPKLILEGITL